MTSKAKTGQPLSNYKNAGHAGPEDVTKEGEMRPEGSTDEQAKKNPVEGSTGLSSLSPSHGYSEGHVGQLGSSHTGVDEDSGDGDDDGGDDGGDGGGDDGSDDDYDDWERQQAVLRVKRFYYNNLGLYDPECYMIANPVVMLSMMAEFHHREHESRGKAERAGADKERLLECMRRADEAGDSDSTEHYKVEHALKLAEEKQHEADTDNAAYKANNLDLLEVSKVDCSEMPEDMVSAQDFMEENINCHNGMAPGPGGKALVIITDQEGQPTHAGSARQNIIREAVQQWRFYSRHIEKEDSMVFLFKAPKDHRYL